MNANSTYSTYRSGSRNCCFDSSCQECRYFTWLGSPEREALEIIWAKDEIRRWNAFWIRTGLYALALTGGLVVCWVLTGFVAVS